METNQIIINGTSAKTEKRNGHLSCDQREPALLILGMGYQFQFVGNKSAQQMIDAGYIKLISIRIGK